MREPSEAPSIKLSDFLNPLMVPDKHDPAVHQCLDLLFDDDAFPRGLWEVFQQKRAMEVGAGSDGRYTDSWLEFVRGPVTVDLVDPALKGIPPHLKDKDVRACPVTWEQHLSTPRSYELIIGIQFLTLVKDMPAFIKAAARALSKPEGRLVLIHEPMDRCTSQANLRYTLYPHKTEELIEAAAHAELELRGFIGCAAHYGFQRHRVIDDGQWMCGFAFRPRP